MKKELNHPDTPPPPPPPSPHTHTLFSSRGVLPHLTLLIITLISSPPPVTVKQRVGLLYGKFAPDPNYPEGRKAIVEVSYARSGDEC